MTVEKKDVLADLKKVKIPWWAHLLGWWNARKARRKSEKLKRKNSRVLTHVATVWSWHHLTDTKRTVQCWYICSECGDGTRMYEFGTNEYLLEGHEKKTVVYAHAIKPWINHGCSNEALKKYGKHAIKKPSWIPE